MCEAEQALRVRIGVTCVETVQRGGKQQFLRSHGSKQAQAGMELQRIHRTEDVRRAIAGMRQHRLHTFAQAWPQQRMSQISGGFLRTGNTVMVRQRAAPQSTQLRQYVPDPVRALAPLAQLGQRLRIVMRLRPHETLQRIALTWIRQPIATTAHAAPLPWS